MTDRPLSLALTTTTLALASAGLLALSACSKGIDAQAQGAAPPPPPVSVAAVVTKQVTEHNEFSGRIEAVESAEIRARVRGTVEAIHFKPGSMVKKGDLLFTIDPRAYQAEMLRGEAAAAGSAARAELARTELFDERAANARQLDAAARADLAAVSSAKLNVEYSAVRAPFSGRIGKAEVTIGNLVDGNVVLTSVVSVDPVYVSFDGDETTYLALGPAARGGASAVKVHLGLANETGFPREGRLDFVDNRIDPTSSSVRMRAIVDNKNGTLTPGLFARVQIGAEANSTSSVLIQDAAVGTDQNRKYVYVLGEGNKAEYRVVELGQSIDGLRVARSGLKPGDRIIVNGLQRVRPGAPVTPQDVPMAATAASGVTVASAK
jgi:multidrug efflux system membrane fusion protein